MKMAVLSFASEEASQALHRPIQEVNRRLNQFFEKASSEYRNNSLFIGVRVFPKTGASDVPDCIYSHRHNGFDANVELEYEFVMQATPFDLRKKLEELCLRVIAVAKAKLVRHGVALDGEKISAELGEHFENSDREFVALDVTTAASPSGLDTPQTGQICDGALGARKEELHGISLLRFRHSPTNTRDSSQRPTRLQDALVEYKSIDGDVGAGLKFVRPDNQTVGFTVIDPDTVRVEFWASDMPVSGNPLTTEIVPEEGIEFLQEFFHGGNLEDIYQFEEP